MAAATSTARRSATVAARPQPVAKSRQRRAPLQVVSPPARSGALLRMSMVMVGLFTILFAVAAVQAVLVQTQAHLDSRQAENLAVAEQIDALEAELAWIESPAGIEAWAKATGLVRAPGYVILSPVTEGALAAPVVADPFVSKRLVPAGEEASGG